MESKAIIQWMNGVVNYVKASEPDLTNRQLAVLMMIHYRNGPHTVRGLAMSLNVSKPVITRALDKLSNLGFLMRQPDDTDGRNVFIVPTTRGVSFLEKLENYFSDEGSQNGTANGNFMPRERYALVSDQRSRIAV